MSRFVRSHGNNIWLEHEDGTISSHTYYSLRLGSDDVIIARPKNGINAKLSVLTGVEFGVVDDELRSLGNSSELIHIRPSEFCSSIGGSACNLGKNIVLHLDDKLTYIDPYFALHSYATYDLTDIQNDEFAMFLYLCVFYSRSIEFTKTHIIDRKSRFDTYIKYVSVFNTLSVYCITDYHTDFLSSCKNFLLPDFYAGADEIISDLNFGDFKSLEFEHSSLIGRWDEFVDKVFSREYEKSFEFLLRVRVILDFLISGRYNDSVSLIGYSSWDLVFSYILSGGSDCDILNGLSDWLRKVFNCLVEGKVV